MPYTVHQLANIAGISVRTLHYYDEVGLLQPSRSAKNGYRTYNDQDLLKLQQILFFRELEFPIADIQRIMQSPTFDMRRALEDHKQLIELKRKRLTALIRTINKTVGKLDMKTDMNDEELYAAFAKSEGDKYAAEAKERWGHTDTYQESARRVAKFTGADWKRISVETDAIMKGLVANRDKGAKAPEVQAFIARHYASLREFYEPNLEMYKGLADMYVGDPRFAAHYEQYGAGMAQFMHDAMHEYVRKHTA